jgi:hypothetical protein
MAPHTYIHTRVTTTNINENRKAETMEKNEQEGNTAKSCSRYVIWDDTSRKLMLLLYRPVTSVS